MSQTPRTVLIPTGAEGCNDRQFMEFHISAELRRLCHFDETLFASSGNVIFANVTAVQHFVQKYNLTVDGANHPEQYLKSGQLNAMALIDEIFHYVCRQYRQKVSESLFSGAFDAIGEAIGIDGANALLEAFTREFPPMDVYRGTTTVAEWLSGTDASGSGVPNKILALEELMLLRLANENPAFEPFFRLFSDKSLAKNPDYGRAWDALRSWSTRNPPFGPEGLDLVSMLKAPVEYSPFDLKGQLDYIRVKWLGILGEWLARLLSGIDLIAEEEKAGWTGGVGSGTPEMPAYEFGDISKEYERFSPDRDWMPNVVLMAKSALVWLSQLTEKYQRPIFRLDQIPDEELDALAAAGFTGLWLIGLWERSTASARIKQICGNPEAAASAYSLDDYDIAGELGGWDALNNLRSRAWKRGIRMASDMVPNHTGMDAKMVVERPDLFVQTKDCPFPGYDFAGENLSHDGRVGIYLENHYYSKTDCAVVFKRVDNATGDARYIYHGNDGTGMPWNDTAQIDFLNPEAREEVIQKILHVARNFPIIRFDAAMVLAKKHIQRLWYPEPGHGGDIASRSRFAIGRDEFERRIPEEFWREVVDRCAKEIPDTLLLAEAFWMMEGYFVRTLGMHRVYNSAFMNMLKREDNEKYRTTIKNTIEFDPEILKRYVNFMNNPDEETASVQFGRGDKYFGVCTMMVAMPGLPMFGHGQIEGFEEKYGMEYRRAYRTERVDEGLVARHRREIFPLMKKRWLFAGVENFRLYDFYEDGRVNENVFVWSNRVGAERAIIFYNNAYARASGWVKTSAAFAEKRPDGARNLVQRTVSEGLGLTVRKDRFCAMQEQRSALWYLRTTEEIEADGLFASLDGFQTQVFVNVTEIDDDDRGHYRTLYESLGGRGIADIHMGIQNIFLKDLYRALADLASPDYFDRIRAICANANSQPPEESEYSRGEKPKRLLKSAKNAEIAECVARAENPARKFFAVALSFLRGNYGAIELLAAKAAPVDEKKRAPKRKTGTEIAADEALITEAWKRFSARLERLLTLPSLEAESRAEFVPEALKLAAFLRKNVFAKDGMGELLGAALALYSIRDLAGDGISGANLRKLADLWSLDRKMADILADSGKNADESLRLLRLLKDLLVLLDVEYGKKGDFASKAAPILLNDAEITRTLGVHTWDNVSWFGKEAAEETLSLALTVASLTSVALTSVALTSDADEGWNHVLVTLAKERKRAIAAIEGSEYRTESLLAQFADTRETRAQTGDTPKKNEEGKQKEPKGRALKGKKKTAGETSRKT